ncbi:D-lactate dehydrogenase, partial [Yersinia pestis PY-53]
MNGRLNATEPVSAPVKGWPSPWYFRQ